MRYFHSLLWLLFAAAWTSAFFSLASMIGGVQWLSHMGQARPAAMNIALAVLCMVAAISVVVSSRVPRGLLFIVGGLVLLHLFNGLGVYLMASTNGHIRATMPLLIYPFFVIGSLIPTNPIFASGLVGNWQLVALPLANSALFLFAAFSNGSDAQKAAHREA